MYHNLLSNGDFRPILAVVVFGVPLGMLLGYVLGSLLQLLQVL